MELEQRIIALEELVTYQDQTLSDLNEVILAQQKIIDKLESHLSRLEDKIKDISSSSIKDMSDESPPPHY